MFIEKQETLLQYLCNFQEHDIKRVTLLSAVFLANLHHVFKDNQKGNTQKAR